jgi:glutamate 5-kinase
VHVDAGAVRALETGGASLLPIGVKRVEGSFGEGALVEVVGPDGRVVARGLSSYDAATIEGALGVRSDQSGGLEPCRPVVIHRDDLVLLPLPPP